MTDDDVKCPACGNPVHRPWWGAVQSALFLDGVDGLYDNVRVIHAVCPVTGQTVQIVESSAGVQGIDTGTRYTFSLIEEKPND